MCGISGIFNPDRPITTEQVFAVERMVAAQTHRGPDDQGIHRSEFAVLGHNRLSIIDLSAAGHQPMSNEDGTIWIKYNGEIYNYKDLHGEVRARHTIRSSSDTEVLVHGYEEWGIDGLLERLRGMFAFALYDLREQNENRGRCILARDRFGIKPLYYCSLSGENRSGENGSGETRSGENGVAFASEVKALAQSGLVSNRRDVEAITGFLLFGSVPAPLTMVQGIRCLMPGHYLVAGGRGLAVRQYWDLKFEPENAAKAEEIEEELGRVLDDSVSRHLISDVPLGVFLSGGVDSAGVVALASRHRPKLTTLTVIFKETEFSEAEPAARITRHFQTDHREVLVTSEDFIHEVPNVLRAMDQPTNDGVNTYFVSKAARESGLKVVLSGLGGDEVFWGYKHYRWMMRNQRALDWFSRVPRVFRRGVSSCGSAYGRIRGKEKWMRFDSLRGDATGQGLYLLLRGFFAPAQVLELLGLTQRELDSAVENAAAGMQSPGVPRAAASNTFNYAELKRYLHDQLLRDTDTFSMAHSLEVRVPFLDHALADYAIRISPHLKIHNQQNQSLNKGLLIRAIQDPVLQRTGAMKKRGFSFPLDQWMKRYSGQLEEMASGNDAVNRKAVHGMWDQFRAGRLHWSRAWALAALGTRV